MENKEYNWKYVSIGGVVRVKIESGEDIAHLGELDQKKWTVLSCPTKGLQFDGKTLSLLDTDADGKIRVCEVVAAAEWITKVLKDKDLLLKGEDTIKLEDINTEDPDGLKLYNSAKQILANLGLGKDSISVADTSDSVAIFAKTQFNGDGIITPASTEDEDLKKTIQTCIDKIGSATDRSGEAGINADTIEKFYAELADYAAWQADAEADKENVFPYGDNTAAALAATEALHDKIGDYFMRCKLIDFDDALAGPLDVSTEKVSAISGQNLATCVSEIESYPLARPAKGGALPFNAINPAWKAAFANFKALAIEEGKETLTEEEWNAIEGKFGAYKAWLGAKKGALVESLGLDEVKALLAAAKKDALLELVAADKALEEEANSIDAVDKLTHLYRDFFKFINNYVIFFDFYSTEENRKAVFDAGKLYIDERCCKLCIKVEDMGQHADMAGLSNMFLIYCKCNSKTLGQSMDIVAVMTDGKTNDLRPGKNAIFYDREGRDWDAVVTKVVDNPINIRQAFWSPYRKFWKFCTEKLNKSASEKDSKLTSNMQTSVNSAEVPSEGTAKKAQAFDIAKFAGIFAAIGMAFGLIFEALIGIAKGIAALKWWQLLLVIAAIMLLISGPACFIAWSKLRKRNLGPVLNANGWAINSKVLVNILFGKTLTNVADYPIVKGNDPFKKRTPCWKKWLRGIFAAIIIAFGVLFFTDKLACIRLPFHKAETEQVEAVVEAEAPAEAAADAAPAAEEAPAEQ